MVIDSHWLLIGFLAGIVIAAAYFIGLALTVRLMLRSDRPGTTLIFGSLFRIAALIAVGFWLTEAAGNGWPLLGYALAFIIVRFLAIRLARPALLTPDASTRAGEQN